MTNPSVRSSILTQDTDGASTSVSLPGTIVADDLLLAIVSSDNPGSTETTTASSGWYRIFHQKAFSSPQDVQHSIFAKIATGTDTLTLAGPSGEDAAIVCMAIKDHAVTSPGFAEIGLTYTLSTESGQPDPPATGTLADKEWLILVTCGMDFNATGNALTTPPTGYTTVILNKSATSSTSVAIGVASKVYSGITNDNPSTFGCNANRPWVTATLAIPSPTSGPFVRTGAGVTADTDGTTTSVTLPSAVVTGDLLLAVATADAPGTTETTTASSGWYRIHEVVYPSNVFRHSLFAKIATGTDTLALAGANQDVSVVCAAIANHGVTSPDFAEIEVTTAQYDGGEAWADAPATGTLEDKEWLILVAAGLDLNQTTTVFAITPTGYTVVATNKSAASTTSVLNGIAVKSLTGTGPENPAVWTTTHSRTWIVDTLAIPGVSSAVTRTGSLTGTGTLTATGLKISAGTGSITSTGTLTGTGLIKSSNTGSITSSGTLTASGSIFSSRTGSIVGTGLLTATGNTISVGTGSITSVGILTASGLIKSSSTGSLTGVGTLTGTGNIIPVAIGSITSTGTLTATGIIPSAGAADNFNRADNADLGTNWNTAAGTALRIVSNEVVNEAAGGSGLEVWNTNLGSANHYSQADITIKVASYSSAAVTVRASSTDSGTYYSARLCPSCGDVSIEKRVGYTNTTIASSAGGIVPSSGFPVTRTLKLVVNGSSLEAFLNGVSVVSVTDTSITTGEQAGILITGGTTHTSIDNWSAGLLGPAAVTATGSISGVGTLTGTGNIIPVAIGSLIGIGVLTATGLIKSSNTGSIIGTGILTGTGQVLEARTGSISSTASLTGVGAVLISSSASWVATGILTAVEKVITLRNGSIVGAGSLLGTQNIIHFNTGSISGAGILTGEGSAFGVVNRTGSLVAIGSLTGNGIPLTGTTGSIIGVAILTATGSISSGIVQRSGAIFSTGLLTANGTIPGPDSEIIVHHVGVSMQALRPMCHYKATIINPTTRMGTKS